MITTDVSGVPMAEFRFKQDWTTKRGGWVQGRSAVSNGWHSLKYVRNLRAADRYVRKIVARRSDPVQYVELPLKETP